MLVELALYTHTSSLDHMRPLGIEYQRSMEEESQNKSLIL